jgi:hemerythrin superfamily protein
MKQTEKADAIDLLIADHKAVQKLFKDFAKIKESGSDDEKEAIVLDACAALTIHTTIEEEIFYPAVRKAIDDADLLDEATVEHAGAKDLIAQLEGMSPGEELYDAKFTVLAEQVNHHVKEEQDEMFPLVRKSKLDTEAVGRKLLQRKKELTGENGSVKRPTAKPAR